MINMRKISAWISIGTLTLSALTGCSGAPGIGGLAPTPAPTNAAELAGYVADALGEVTSMEYDSVINMTAVMSMGDMMSEDESAEDLSTEMNVEAKMTCKATGEPVAAYTTGSVAVTVFDENNVQDVESYVVREDDKFVTYMNDGTETWTKSDSDVPEMDDLYNLSMFEGVRDGQIEASLADSTETIGEQTVYRLDIKLSGDTIEEYLGSSLETMSSVFGDDYDSVLADMTVPVAMYIADGTNLPVRMEFDGTELGNKIMSYVQSFITVNVSAFKVSSEYKSFNEIPEITVPEDVVANAVPAADSDSDESTDEELPDEAAGDADPEYEVPEPDENGRYAITSSATGSTAKFALPEDQTVNYSVGDALFTLCTNEGLPYSQYIYSFLDDMTPEKVEETARSDEWYGDVDPKDVSEGYTSETHVIDVNGMTVSYAQKSCVLYAGTEDESFNSELTSWTALDGTVFIISYDYYDETGSSSDDNIDYEQLIRSAFEKVTFE
ncbi:MAG: hypothetical protein IKF10_04050 [Lachnospiraceae bacterium]|nr:hypothetical protein [Lachnospiraceae bacterium]